MAWRYWSQSEEESQHWPLNIWLFAQKNKKCQIYSWAFNVGKLFEFECQSNGVLQKIFSNVECILKVLVIRGQGIDVPNYSFIWLFLYTLVSVWYRIF